MKITYSINGTDLVIVMTLGLSGTGIIAKTKDLSASQGGLLCTRDLDEAGALSTADRIVEWYTSRSK